ncbi:hypothetical protein ES705_41729 [subsurface metagenome]
MSNNNGDLMGNKIIERDKKCPLLTEKPGEKDKKN